MMRIFCVDISASSINPSWTQVASLASSQDLMIRVNSIVQDFGRTKGTAVIFSASVSLPTSPRRLFDHLRDVNSRKWHDVQELFYVIQGNDPRNRGLHHSSRCTLFVQESYMDSTGPSFVVYSHVDKLVLTNVLNGENPDLVTMMPSGFVILPDGMPSSDNDVGGGGSGSILTIAYYMVLTLTGNPLFIPDNTMDVFKQLIANTVTDIENAVLHNNS
ncbi:putative homeobox-leucine zipper protein PROTODERMAL FACTOR [Sesbania bispinosa]|nr:putative homeobox-leucine zipper protein PROTODERMAL FACTOR [Sesbania bispinosa]